MTHEEIVSFWGSENLRRWTEPSLTAFAIPRTSKWFLMEVGLPINQDWTLRFDAVPVEMKQLPNNKDYCVIGFDYCVPICLDVERRGCVIAIETQIGGTTRFVNTCVEQFGEFLVYYQRYRKIVQNTRETETPDLIRTVTEQMKNSDLAAFELPENYWPLIIEQMNAGFL